MLLELHVELPARSYPVMIGAGALARLPQVVPPDGGMVVTDTHVDELYGDLVLELIGKSWSKIVVPPGETSKSVLQWKYLLEQMAKAGLGRSATLVALGGGVVGDLTGFAAASYMRGIRFVQVPTTLLSMVDSSVGGKTGINLQAGKNLAGAFHQPEAVLADVGVLVTLPSREFSSGMAEVVKMAVALDADFFTWLEQHAADIMALDAETLSHMVARCCRLKADVVQQDEREAGLRSILNFGHTFGHALEWAANPSITHGEAVAQGMIFAMSLSIEECGFTPEEAGRVVRLLSAFGAFPADIQLQNWDVANVLEFMNHDKKNDSSGIRFVLCEKIGNCHPAKPLSKFTPDDVDEMVKGILHGNSQ